MGYKDNFYLTVKSTDSVSYFPDNTSADFYAKLPYTIDLDGDWSIGVNQIWIPKRWYNVVDIQLQFVNNEGANIVDSASEVVQISDGYYHTIDTLIQTLNQISNIGNNELCQFSYNNITQKVTIDVKDGFTLTMSATLCSMLGSEQQIFAKKNVCTGCPDLHITDGLIHVNTNIVGGFMYSNSRPNVIKTVCTAGYNFGELIYDGLLSDHTRIFLKTTDVIRIMITDKTGVIKQMGGETIVQLHFKRE